MVFARGFPFPECRPGFFSLRENSTRSLAVDGHVRVLGLVRMVEAHGDGGGQVSAAFGEAEIGRAHV